MEKHEPMTDYEDEAQFSCAPGKIEWTETDHGERQFIQEPTQNLEFQNWFYSAIRQSDPAEFGGY